MALAMSSEVNKLNYPFDKHPKPGTTIEVAPGVRWLTMPMPGSLAHINLYLLEDTKGWYIVDTGMATKETSELWQDIFRTELENKPVVGVICTHMHPDHTGQSEMITNQFRCPFFMTHGEYYQAKSFANNTGNSHSSWTGMDFYTRAGMPVNFLEQLGQMWAKRSADSMSMPGLPTSFERIQHNQILKIGNYSWRIVVGSGHSPEHACLYCEELKIMISGDQILPIITSNVSVHPNEPNANPLKYWMESHERFMSMPEDTFVLPAHNLPFYGIRERLQGLIDHHEHRMLLVETACSEKPQIAKDLLPIMFERELEPRQKMMALGEAIAHIHLLMDRNYLSRILDDDGCYRFESIDPNLQKRIAKEEALLPSDAKVVA